MKKLQLKYSTPKIKLNSVKKLCENKDNSSNIKNCATCSTMSITNKILTNAEQSEENSIQLTDSALFAKTFADFKMLIYRYVHFPYMTAILLIVTEAE